MVQFFSTNCLSHLKWFTVLKLCPIPEDPVQTTSQKSRRDSAGPAGTITGFPPPLKLQARIDELEAEVPGSGGPQATRKLACLDRGQPIEDGDPGMNGRISLAAAQTYVVKARQALEKVRRAREGVGRARKEEEERMRQPCAICFESLAAWSELETVSHTTQPHSHTAIQHIAYISSLTPDSLCSCSGGGACTEYGL